MTAQTEAVDFFAFDNSYARLPDRFFARLRPTPVAAPRLVRLNKELAWHLRLDPGTLAAPEGVEILAGNRVPKRGEPLAMAYAGHATFPYSGGSATVSQSPTPGTGLLSVMGVI